MVTAIGDIDALFVVNCTLQVKWAFTTLLALFLCQDERQSLPLVEDLKSQEQIR